jgi:UDP-N-acetylmuramoylalanine--D-glutamate ligase
MTNASYTLVAGLGKTGRSIARYLRRKQMPFVVYDSREHPADLDEFRTEFNDIDVYLKDFPDPLYATLTDIICSPGVSFDLPFMQKARAHKIPIYGDIECLAREIDAPVIAITGTNGKSTVTTLVGEMATAAGIKVAVAGNIGTPVLDLLGNDTHYDLWVLELSSFQLDLTYSLAPIAATILNISADHLDRHHDLKSYTAAKQRIYHHAANIFYNRDDTLTEPSAVDSKTASQIKNFGLDSPPSGQWGIQTDGAETYLVDGTDILLTTDALKIKGRHNWSNALAASALAQTVGIDVDVIRDVLKQFTGLPHRAQWVRTLDGVDWINDSKGTNIGATYSAILGIGGAMQGKIVLIAGGQGKGADFTELRAPVAEHVRTLVLIGEDADKIEQALHSVVPVMRASTLEEAVQVAHQQAQSGDVVMLSPACASQDMFRDFNDRGRVFVSAVDAL